MRPRTVTVRIPSRRVLAAALAAVCALSQLSAIVHASLVRHETCPEHGELIHSDEAQLAIPSTAATPSVEDSLHAALPASVAQAHAHDHCSVARLGRESSIAPVVATTLELTLSPIDAPIWVDVAATGQSDRYRLAPKQSPPAV